MDREFIPFAKKMFYLKIPMYKWVNLTSPSENLCNHTHTVSVPVLGSLGITLAVDVASEMLMTKYVP